MPATKAVCASEFYSVATWCDQNPGGKVILGVSTLAEAAAVGSVVPRSWRGTTRIVFSDEANQGIKPGIAKMLAVARVRFAFARHRCAWTVVQ